MNKNSIAAFLAIMSMIGFLIMFALLGWAPVPPENKDFFNMGFIALIGFVGTAFGYYLGSSQSSAQKNDLLLNQSPPLTGTFVTGINEKGFVRLPLVLFVLFILSALLIAGCATGKQETPQSLAAKSLLTARQGIIGAATTADSFCTQGILKQADCSKAERIYIKSQGIYVTASDAFLLYLVSGDAKARQEYDKVLPSLQALLTDLDSLTKGGKP